MALYLLLYCCEVMKVNLLYAKLMYHAQVMALYFLWHCSAGCQCDSPVCKAKVPERGGFLCSWLHRPALLIK